LEWLTVGELTRALKQLDPTMGVVLHVEAYPAFRANAVRLRPDGKVEICFTDSPEGVISPASS